MNSLYQIVMIGSPYLEEELAKEFVEYPIVKIYHSLEETDTQYPVLCLYYGVATDSKEINEDISNKLKKMKEVEAVLPIVPDIKQFNNFIPECLRTSNGFELSNANELMILKNYILRFFGLIDVNRKVFISYKRTDCQTLAHQLYEALVKARYAPFLDAYSIEYGTDFQKQLLHELSDSEMMVVINSTDYMQSKWCREELEKASQMGIGIIEVRFDDSPDFGAGFARQCEIGSRLPHFEEYDNKIIDRIVQYVESYRANSYAFRQQNNIKLLREKYVDLSFRKDNGQVFVSRSNNIVGYLINHLPQSFDAEKAFNVLCELFPSPNKHKYSLEYYGSYCREHYKDHYSWLNTYLPITINDLT